MSEEYAPHSKMCRCDDCVRHWASKQAGKYCQWCRKELPNEDDCHCLPAGDEQELSTLRATVARLEEEKAEAHRWGQEQVCAEVNKREAAEAECIEQARLNGMGAEREAALLAKLAAVTKDRNQERQFHHCIFDEARKAGEVNDICQTCDDHADLATQSHRIAELELELESAVEEHADCALYEKGAANRITELESAVGRAKEALQSAEHELTTLHNLDASDDPERGFLNAFTIDTGKVCKEIDDVLASLPPSRPAPAAEEKP